MARVLRLSLLALSLTRAAGWSATPPLGSVRYQGGVRRAVGPSMSGDRGDSLSAEFERLAAARSGTVFGCAPDLLRERKVAHSWVLIFNSGQDDEGLYTLQGSEAVSSQHGNDGTCVPMLTDAHVPGPPYQPPACCTCQRRHRAACSRGPTMH